MWSLLTNSWFKTCIHDLVAFGVVTIISCRRSANESRETNRFLLATYQVIFDDLGHPLTDVEHLVDLKPLLGVTRVQRSLLVLRIFVAEICCHCSAVKTRMKFQQESFHRQYKRFLIDLLHRKTSPPSAYGHLIISPSWERLRPTVVFLPGFQTWRLKNLAIRQRLRSYFKAPLAETNLNIVLSIERNPMTCCLVVQSCYEIIVSTHIRH